MVTSNSNRRVSSLEAAGVKISHKKDVSTTTNTPRKPVNISPRSSTPSNRLPYRPLTSHSASHHQICTSPRLQRSPSRTELVPRKIDSPISRSATPVKDKKDDVIKERDEQLRMQQTQLKELEEIINKLREELKGKDRELEEQESNHKSILEAVKERYEQDKRDMEKKSHEQLETQRDKLCGEIFGKDRVIEKLRNKVDDMRDSIQEMHREHQTRLTTLTQQLQQQQTDDLNQIEKEFKERMMEEIQKYEANLLNENQELSVRNNELANQLSETKKSLETKLANEYETHRQILNEITTSQEIERDQLTKEHLSSLKEKDVQISSLQEKIKELQLSNQTSTETEQKKKDYTPSDNTSKHSNFIKHDNCLELLQHHDNQQLIMMIQLHQKEVNILKEEYQKMIDRKNDEISYLVFKNQTASQLNNITPSLSVSEQYNVTSFVNLNYI